MRLSVLFLFVLFIMSRCDDRRIYEYSHDFKERAWHVADTSRFEFAIKDTGKKYNVFYIVRNSLDYPYARLFVQYAMRDTTGVEIHKKLVTSYLFDQKTGKPFGQSGLGDIFDHRFILEDHFEFQRPGTYEVTLQQSMRLDTLPGILSVGVRIEEAEEKK